MKFSIAKCLILQNGLTKSKFMDYSFIFAIKQLIKIETRKGNASVLQIYKNVVDFKVFGYKTEFSLKKWSFFATKCAHKIGSLFLN